MRRYALSMKGRTLASIALGTFVALATIAIAAWPEPAAAGDPPAAKKKKDEPPAPLRGTTTDYDYDGHGNPIEAWQGRVYVHPDVAGGKDVPLLVFIHGLNVEKIKYRWIGGGNEGDVRRIVGGLIDEGLIEPMVVAAPTSIDPRTMVNALTTWPDFELDRFVDRTQAALGNSVRIDRRRVIVAGHSGAGCNVHGGIATALTNNRTTTIPLGLVIDGCMATDFATEILKAPRTTNLVVSWQEISWANRPTNDFRRVFSRAIAKDPAAAGVLRELDLERPSAPSPHDAMVGIVLRKYLPRFFPGRVAVAPATSAKP
jgi:hypothetical protein